MSATVLNVDALTAREHLGDRRAGLIVCDPPYHKVVNEAWDHQHKTLDDHLGFIADVSRVALSCAADNANGFWFCWPTIQHRIACALEEDWRILAHVVWAKPYGMHSKQRPEDQRTYRGQTERIFHIEPKVADGARWKNAERAWKNEQDALHSRLCEPLIEYLRGEWLGAGFNDDDGGKATGTASMARHYFSASQWQLPTRKRYEQLRAYATERGKDILRREWSDLRQQYEALRRRFDVGTEQETTDVWTFAPMRPGKGTHPCEKPQEMLRHMVRVASRPGELVLDMFAGSGALAEACKAEGRDYIGFELDAKHFQTASRRAGLHVAVTIPIELAADAAPQPAPDQPAQLSLFA